MAKGDVCPFDGLPCDFVDSCDDAMVLRWGRFVKGLDTENGSHCSRAVFPLK